MPGPRFDRHGYDKHRDITEEEYLAQLTDNADDLDDDVAWITAEIVPCPDPAVWCPPGTCDHCGDEVEGEPNEDTYLPGIPDYDRFNRPSWET